MLKRHLFNQFLLLNQKLDSRKLQFLNHTCDAKNVVRDPLRNNEPILL